MPVGRVLIYNIEYFFISSAFPFAANYDANGRRFVPDEYLMTPVFGIRNPGFMDKCTG